MSGSSASVIVCRSGYFASKTLLSDSEAGKKPRRWMVGRHRVATMFERTMDDRTIRCILERERGGEREREVRERCQ